VGGDHRADGGTFAHGFLHNFGVLDAGAVVGESGDFFANGGEIDRLLPYPAACDRGVGNHLDACGVANDVKLSAK
jgi:hypothetical protein